jgi:phosphate transport system substrate-binding protein
MKPEARMSRALSCAFCVLAVLAPAVGMADVVVPEGKHVEIRGSLSMGAVARAVAEKYMTDHPDAVVTVAGGGTHRGLKSVLVGTADIAMGTEGIPEAVAKMAADEKIVLKAEPVFSDAVIVVVSPSNPISNVSLKDLRDIFRGKLTRWADVGRGGAERTDTKVAAEAPKGIAAPAAPKAAPPKPPGLADAGAPAEDADIEVVTFDANSGLYETFKKEVLGDNYVITPSAKEISYRNLEEAIGAKGIGYTGLHGRGNLKALSIDGVVGSAENVRSKHYPIARELVVYHREPASKATQGVIEYFLAKDKGQQIAESLGNVPVR